MRLNNDLHELQRILGTDIQDKLFDKALTHGSVNQHGGSLPKNNPLAFLGDAVLELAVCNRAYPSGGSVGDLTLRANKEVRNTRLAAVANAWGIGPYIALGEGAQNERATCSVLAAAVEAILGAAFISRQPRVDAYEHASALALRLLDRPTDPTFICKGDGSKPERAAQEPHSA